MSLIQSLHTTIDRDRLQSHLEWFAGVRRDTGGPGEVAAAEYISRILQESGVEVRVHEFDAFLSYPREASLLIAGSGQQEQQEYDCVTHSFTRSTPPGGLTGEITYLPDGDLSGAAGKIILIDGLCTPITVLEASKAGVRGIVFANQGDVVHNMIATTIWGTPSADQLDRLPTLSAVSISRPDADRLKVRLAEGPVTVRMHALVETGWYESILPEAIIPGTGPDAEEFILAGAHYCSWEYGITDNSTGVACLLELARALQANRDGLRRSVRLGFWPGHSHGRYSGSTWYADNFFHELADNCVAYHNIDSPGVRDATTYVARHTTAEIEGFCSDLINSMTGQADPPVHRPSRAADQSFLAHGIPAFSTYPFLPEGHPERKSWTGGCANAWWWHSSADTLDKADVDILTLDTRISATGIVRLANAEILPLDPNSAAREILEYATAFAAETDGHLDSARFVAAAETLLAASEELMQFAQSGLSAQQRTQLNRTLMSLSRALLPVTYSKGGRHTHDPAEWSPVMHNTPSSLFPGLTTGLNLKALEGEDLYGFVRTGTVRQLNRAVDALNDASRLCRSVTVTS
jgi:hypothetical protein